MLSNNRPATLPGVVLLIAGLACGTLAYAEDEGGERTFDGLVTIESDRAEVVQINPDADFGVYKRVAFLEPLVRFRKNWVRDQNRGRRSFSRVNENDVERIKESVATLFLEVFQERLRENDGYEVVASAGEDVLLIRPAIIDLDISAPDTQSNTGRVRNYTSTVGSATLYIELYDSVTGAILGRAADRRTVRAPGGRVTWSDRITNEAEARRQFGIWADRLRAFLDEHYTP